MTFAYSIYLTSNEDTLGVGTQDNKMDKELKVL
jgi:hypothetical protein